MGEVATCQDRREWALFWLEDEIAFVHPQTRESYKWDRQIYMSHPEIYAGLESEQRKPDFPHLWPMTKPAFAAPASATLV